jgi:hypothetical protein
MGLMQWGGGEAAISRIAEEGKRIFAPTARFF